MAFGTVNSFGSDGAYIHTYTYECFGNLQATRAYSTAAASNTGGPETLSVLMAGIHADTPAGTFDIWAANIGIQRADGTTAWQGRVAQSSPQTGCPVHDIFSS